MKEPINYIEIPGLEHYPHVTYSWVIILLFIGVGFALRGTLKIAPVGLHNFFEAAIVGLYDFSDSIMGKEGRPYFPLIGTLAFFILASNLIGLIPGCISPTANINTNFALALTVFILYNYVAIRKHGFGYIKHFLGPIWWLTPLMIIVETMSHIARPITLSFRLFGNIRGEELVILVLGVLIPIFLPMPILAFAVFTSFLQTLVFVLLTMVYISLALEEAH